MNDVGGSESGRGLRAVKSSRTSDSNFEYDDSEWDVGIGNLIIDLDADIEKTNEAATRSSSGGTTSNLQQNLTRSAPPSTTAPNSQMHIPQSPATTSSTTANNSTKGKSSTTASTPGSLVLPLTPSTTNTSGKIPASSSESTTSTNSVISVSMEHTTMSDKGLKMKIKRSKPGTKSVDARHEIVKSDVLAHAAASSNSSSSTSLMKGPLSINETKSSFNLSSQKDGKETKVDKELLLDIGGQNDQNSAKAKAAKRPTSTHKKVKLATGVTASIVSTKKEVGAGESKSTTINTTTVGNNNGKEGFNSSNSSSLSNIGSAFVKTSVSSSNIKTSTNSGNMLGNDLTSANSGAGTTTNSRSIHNNTNTHTHINSSNTTNTSHTQLTTGSPSKATDKTNNSSSAEKGVSSSPSYGKKARVGTYAPEKNSSVETAAASNTQVHGGAGSNIGFSSLSYRNIAAAGSIEGVNTTSSAGAAFPGNISSAGHATNATKDSIAAMNSRVPVQQQISFQDACVGTTVGTVTEPDCLGPCEPGTSVTLEGIVWHETESGVLVVNVTWRGKTYVGTLLDCTKSDWASPRFCDSPTSDLEMRTPKNRGKRGRAQTATPVSDPGVIDASKSSSAKLRNGAKGRRGATNAFVAPVSPLKPDQWQKRKTRGSETESQEESSSTTKSTKRLKLNKESSGRQIGSPAPSGLAETPGPYSPALIECPEPNCSKKYKHINGLRYHQNHAHSNNFAAEDSDSNMSTASNTNLNIVADAAGSNDDPNLESRIDVDAIEASGAESNSAPTTPVKKQTTKSSELEEKDKGDEVVVDLELKIGSEIKTALPCKLTLGVTGKEKEDSEKGTEQKESPTSKDKELPMIGLPSRTPILTVPTLPFMSLQNRNQLQHSLHRAGNPEASDKPNRDQETNVMGKAAGNSNSSSIPPSKGISWQPHAISPFHTQQQNLNVPVTLNVPMGSSITSRDHDKATKESKSSSLASGGSPTKKPKHKKKSKDKSDKDRDRDRDGKSKLSSDYISRDTIKPGLFSPSAIQKDKEREERRGYKLQELSPHRDTDGSGHGGENPQSPAYSDISDANDSGPESDMNLEGKDHAGKMISSGDPKKEGPGGQQNLSSFYSPFYTPMESPYLSSTNPPVQIKSERNSGPGGGVSGVGAPLDDQGAEKFKSKSSTSLPQHISAHMDDRRSSPKLDYHHQKYLSPQQHYFPYPYPNYHFDQGYAGLIPENSYSHNNRSIVEEKERETEEQRVRLNSKGRASSDCVKEESGIPTNLSSLKQDPGPLDRGDHRPLVMEEKTPPHPPEPKSNFSSDYQEKRHGASGISSYGHASNKHPKESRREREERHAKDVDGKDGIKSSGRASEQGNRHKNIERDRDRENSNEKEKNEGAKPTMETQGPPPPPTAGSYAYYPSSYLPGNPYSIPFDPNHHIFRQVMVPSPYPGSPYMHSHAGNIARFSQPPAPASLPEDLSRSNPAAPPPKGLDILQHHAYYAASAHKIHELQERALKSPSPQIGANRESGGSNLSGGPTNLSSTPASPSPSLGRGSIGTGSSNNERKQPTDLTKEAKPSINPLSGSGSGTESSRSPPIHHVHTHMHSHTHIGYPIIPTVPPQYSPNLSHYGVLTTPAAAPPASVIPPFTSQKPS